MSEVAIANQALALLGEAPITSLEDPSVKAGLAKTMYNANRDAVLEAHNWTFATKWLQLNKVAEPSFGLYKNKFLLPAEVMRVFFCGTDPESRTDYAIEGEFVVTNDLVCLVTVVEKITDTSKFSALFTQALAARLAAEMSQTIVSSNTLTKFLYESYNMKIREATSRDQLQGSTKRIRSKWLKQGRVGGYNNNMGGTV